MFTGVYPNTRGQRSLVSLLKPRHRNLFRDLKDAGYRNVAYGKNDLLDSDISLALAQFVQKDGKPVPGPAGFNSTRPAPHSPMTSWGIE